MTHFAISEGKKKHYFCKNIFAIFKFLQNTAFFAIFEYTENIALLSDQNFWEIIVLTQILIKYLMTIMERIALVW